VLPALQDFENLFPTFWNFEEAGKNHLVQGVAT
jgi:hypothetical protein